MTLRRALGLRIGIVGARVCDLSQRLERVGFGLLAFSLRVAPLDPVAVRPRSLAALFETLDPIDLHDGERELVWTPNGLEDPEARSFRGSARLVEGVGLVWDREAFEPPPEREFPNLWYPLELDEERG